MQIQKKGYTAASFVTRQSSRLSLFLEFISEIFPALSGSSYTMTYRKHSHVRINDLMNVLYCFIVVASEAAVQRETNLLNEFSHVSSLSNN